MRVETNKLSRLSLLIASVGLGLGLASHSATAAPVDANYPHFASTTSLYPALANNEADDCLDESADGSTQMRAMSMTMGSAPAARTSLAGLDSQFGNRSQAHAGSGTEELSAAARSRMQLSGSLSGDDRSSQRNAATLARSGTVKDTRSSVAEPSSWVIQSSDKTLNGALTRWATAAGWQLVWELPVDYAVDARTVLPGTFEDAVGAVARSMEGAQVPMKAVFYRGNKVLRVVAKNG